MTVLGVPGGARSVEVENILEKTNIRKSRVHPAIAPSCNCLLRTALVLEPRGKGGGCEDFRAR